MITKVLLYLHEDSALNASWLLMDATGHIVESKMHAPLSELPMLSKNITLDVIIPGEEVLVTKVELPKISRQKLRDVLPFALEEKLISDVHDLHFAIDNKITETPIPVVVVKKQKMDAWLHMLKEMNLTPQTLIPAIFAIPHDWHICLDNDIALVRTEKYAGFACDSHNLHSFLSATFNTKAPECIYLHRFHQKDLSLEFESITVRDIDSHKNLLICMRDWIKEYPYINLLQGKYAIKEKINFLKNSWTIAATVTISWMAILFASHLSSYSILKSAITQSELEIAKIYQRHFPNATAIVAPRDRMTSELKKLAGNTQNQAILSWLSYIAKAQQQATDLQIQSLDFRDQHLMLTLFSKTFDELDAFNKSLISDGLQVKQQSASMSGSFVKATLSIQKGVL